MNQGQIGTNPTTEKVLPQEQNARGDSSLHKYFTQIPNIILHIGLKAIDIAVYMAIKRTCGENGVSEKSTLTLAKEAGVCKKAFLLSKKRLAKINPVIGKPLIKFQHRPSEKEDWDTDIIFVVDIWDENMQLLNPAEVKCGKGGVPKMEIGVKVPVGVGVKVPHKEEQLQEEQVDRSTFSEKTSSDEDVQKLADKLESDGIVVCKATERNASNESTHIRRPVLVKWIQTYGLKAAGRTCGSVIRAFRKNPKLKSEVPNLERYITGCLKKLVE